MNGRKVLFAGDVGLDLTADIPNTPAADEKVVATASAEDAGGVVSNASVACTLAGISAKALLAIGSDPAGDQAVRNLQRRGVEVAIERIAGGRTCRAVILIDHSGEKRLVLIPGNSMYPTVEQATAAQLDDVEWMHTAIYDAAAASVLIERCRAEAIRWSLDLEPATFAAGIEPIVGCLNGAEVVLVNDRAAQHLGADPVGQLFDLGVSNVVLTHGADGAEWCAPTGRFRIPAERPPGGVRDSTGAGDALAGWLVARLVAGDPPIAALTEAVAAASLSCGAVGAQRSYPSRRQVVEMISKQPGYSPHTEEASA